MANKPYQNRRLAMFLEAKRMELKHKKTQTEIAEDAGFINPNMRPMIKKGATKLPVDRVPALDWDPALRLRLALEQSEGSKMATAIYEIIDQPIIPSEMVWLKEIRDAFGDTDPRLRAAQSIGSCTITSFITAGHQMRLHTDCGL